MAVTVEKRPIGVTLGSAVSATINQDYGSAYATVNKTAHGLSEGQYVYIISNIDSYNGFWIIDVINTGEFLLRDAPYVAWVQDANITYYAQSTVHGWSAIENPIVYELSNTRYPTNSIDTARTISSISNDSGYLNLNLSGSLGTFEELAFVKISNATNSDLNGVYQIIDKIATNDVTVNLAYAAVTNAGIVGATVQLYYQNYNILVRIYAGINSSHEWQEVKPYELAATLQFIPDSNNRVKFSVSEILKAYVQTRNNLTLDTLPNNTDFWTQFYIETAEQYDTSNGYTVTTTTSAYASDQVNFEGYGVNAEMPFKNVHSGYLSDYMNNKFLTLFILPVLFACTDETPSCYNEVTFINASPSVIRMRLKQEYYSGSTLVTTVNDNVAAAGEGVYRIPISPSCSYNRVDVTVIGDASAADESTFGQITGNQTLTYNAASSVGSAMRATGLTPGQISNIGYVKFQVPAGTYNVGGTTNVTILSGTGTYQVRYFILDYNLNILDTSADYAVTSPSPDTNSEDLVAASPVAYIGVQFVFTSGSGSITMDGSIFARTAGASSGTEATDIVLSETKRFDIDCGCSEQELRLTWLNNLGGFDYWTFTAEKDKIIEIGDASTTSENIFPNWPKSYGETADTIRKQTYRDSNEGFTVRSQLLTQDQVDAISYIKSSVLVQVINSRTDRRTVLVDTDSFVKYKENDKTFTVQFNISYTNNLPSQDA